MNISSQVSIAPLAAGFNPQADNLRRENNQREVITQPAAASQSAAEKGVASEKDKAKTPSQQNEYAGIIENKKQAEADKNSISGQSEQQSKEKNNGQNNENARGKSDIETFADEQLIKELKRRDQEVRRHEQAHAAVGGPHTGAPTYEFTIGPDGQKYATSGEVSVDLSPVPGDPQATITKLQKVHAAALAPADPSVQDTRVAAQATRLILQAQSELLAEKLQNPALAKQESPLITGNTTFYQDENNSSAEINNSVQQSYKFDQFINQTLASQDTPIVERTEDVNQRQNRIETFYSNISNAYEAVEGGRVQITA